MTVILMMLIQEPEWKLFWMRTKAPPAERGVAFGLGRGSQVTFPTFAVLYMVGFYSPPP